MFLRSRADSLRTYMVGSIERRLFVGFGVATLLVVILGWISYGSTRRWTDDRAAEKRTLEIETRIQTVLALVTEAESAVRAFVASGDETFLPRIDRTRALLGPHFDALRRLVTEPGQRQRLERLEALVEDRLRLADSSVDVAKRSGLEPARGRIAGGEGRRLQDSIRALVREMSSHQSSLLVERGGRSERTVAFTRAAILASAILAVVLVWMAYALVRHELAIRRATEQSLSAFNQTLLTREDKLRSVTDRLTKVLEFSLDVICTIDREGRFVQVSPACERVLGYRAEELLGTPYVEKVLPADRLKSEEAAAMVMSGSPTFDFQNRYVRKDGTVVCIMWSAQWSDAEGILFCVGRDVTEQQRLREEAERRQTAELEVPAARCTERWSSGDMPRSRQGRLAPT